LILISTSVLARAIAGCYDGSPFREFKGKRISRR
jgi:hypothetical protein